MNKPTEGAAALDIALLREPADVGFTRYSVLYRSQYGEIAVAIATLPNIATTPAVEDALLLLGSAVANTMDQPAPVRHLRLV